MGLLSRLFTPKSMQSVPTQGWIRAFGVGLQDFAPRVNQDNMHSFFAVFACVSKITHDISKLPLLSKINTWAWASGMS